MRYLVFGALLAATLFIQAFSDQIGQIREATTTLSAKAANPVPSWLLNILLTALCSTVHSFLFFLVPRDSRQADILSVGSEMETFLNVHV